MSGTTDMNIVLGQANAIKELHNIRKQNLELNQQFVAQKAENKKKEDKLKVQNFDTSNSIEIKDNEEKKKKQDPKDNQKKAKKKITNDKNDLSEGTHIDIRI
ncbi:MAG: hypothetical protein SV375_00910 [Thermodesulfobacteriota bacterium]|nr:hypothetical protein [Thermodesulfobacteriota bacterium]